MPEYVPYFGLFWDFKGYYWLLLFSIPKPCLLQSRQEVHYYYYYYYYYYYATLTSDIKQTPTELYLGQL